MHDQPGVMLQTVVHVEPHQPIGAHLFFPDVRLRTNQTPTVGNMQHLIAQADLDKDQQARERLADAAVSRLP
jgi:hypothetical protein